MTAEQAQPTSNTGLRPAFAAVRVRLGLVLVLFALAALGWWWLVEQMRGMDEGPWTSLGAFGWFLGVWVVMMAAMMFPSIAPTVALYSRMTKARLPLAPAAFTTGYLLTWAGAGVAAWIIALGISRLTGDGLAWENAGRTLAGVTIIVAAVYELTPLKDVCLGKCRSPLGFLLGAWRDGVLGGLRMGAKNGAWCVGCCWALMASLFALGVMSIPWMAIVAGIIAIEKTLPWRRAATYATTAVLVALGVLVLAFPTAIPWLTVPGDQPMSMMTPD
jgi:predicted metal-binding membrane protein